MICRYYTMPYSPSPLAHHIIVIIWRIRSHDFQLLFNARDKQPWSHWKAVNVMGKQYDACIVIKHKSGLIFIYFLNINFIIHSISFSIIYLFSFKNCYCININNFVYLCNPFIVIVDWKVILDYLHSHYLCKYVSFSFSMRRGWFERRAEAFFVVNFNNFTRFHLSSMGSVAARIIRTGLLSSWPSPVRTAMICHPLIGFPYTPTAVASPFYLRI